MRKSLIKPESERAPAPAEPVAEPAPEVVPEPAPSMFELLDSLSPSPAMATHSASMGRNMTVMIAHVREHLTDAFNMIRAIGVDAAAARDFDSVETVKLIIATLKG
jgi:hypothetical protein